MSSAALGTYLGGVVCLAASPYLAGLVRTVPDRADTRWWRPTGTSRAELGRAACTAVVVGALAGAAAGAHADPFAVLPALVAVALLGTPLILIDIAHHRLPHRLTYAAAIATTVLLAVAAAATGGWAALLRALAAGVVVFVVLELVRRAAPSSFGVGDVNLGGVVGGVLGWFGWTAVVYGVFAGFVLGALVSVVLIAARRATLKTHIPFGPMLLCGALIVLALDLVPTGAA